ncbi:MAG: UDP-N-acetylglucosamine--N-acetylmuramyl-(pentapeptide) pyrophosphoryl-undecaprenol N-acetylglucosamine transferase [Dehalococcoidia bacterium]
MKLALTAGGTGGHILPALAVLDAMHDREGLVTEVRFFGPEDRGERSIVESRGIRFEAVPSAGVRGRGPIELAQSAWELGTGVFVGVRKLQSFNPDAVFSTGGYGSFPTSVAARLLRRPLVVYLPDVTPGWAVSAEKRLATRVATTTEEALKHLPRKKTTVTGYPVRKAFFEMSREDARRELGLLDGDRVIVIAGASQGAKAINDAIFAAVPQLAGVATIFHMTGASDLPRAAQIRNELPPAQTRHYQVADFRNDLPVLMKAADLGVFRAGASVLGELPAAGLPSVLIPGTFAGGHQRDNARWLAEGGAAVVVEEAGMDLGASIRGLILDDARLAAMREAANALAHPDAADRIADLIVEVARK